MQESIVLKKNPAIVSRVIDDEVILVPIFKTSKEMNCIYSLNPAAALIWELIDGKNTVKDIKDTTLRKFDITKDDADKELLKFLKDLKEIKALK